MNGFTFRKAQPAPSRRLNTSREGSPLGRYSEVPSPPPRNTARGFVVPQTPVEAPAGRVLLEGYRGAIMNNFEGEGPRVNALDTTLPQSSLNINDPVQVHLLVETALGDSKDYELLAPEEVDGLKKQIQFLSQRIEQTRQNLAIQTKYRDAAISMSKLYGGTRGKRNSDSSDTSRSRSSLLGGRTSDHAKEADQERISSERKCELLAQDLWNLEKRLMEPQKRLLQHTAGVLQMTHKGPKRNARISNPRGQSTIPGSPESMYAYHNARNSIETPLSEELFDDRSLYRSADNLDDLDFGYRRDSFDSAERKPSVSKPRPTEDTAEQLRIITTTESKLEILNHRLRDIIVKVNPQQEQSYQWPPSNPSTTSANVEILISQLEYLEQGISMIDAEQANLVNKQASEAAAQSAAESAAEVKVEELNREMRALLLPHDPSRPTPPQVSGQSLEDQIRYFRDSMEAIESQILHSASTSAKDKNLEQTETVLMGLWDIIQSGEEEIRNRRIMRRQARLGAGSDMDGASDVSENEDAYDEAAMFSLQAFSAKVQRMAAQITALKEHKEVLQRQIKQQRELNNRSDSTKDAELLEKKDELKSMQGLLERTEADADEVRTQLAAVKSDIEILRANDVSAKLAPLQAELTAKSAELASQSNEILTIREELAAKSEDLNLMQDKLDAGAVDYANIEAELNAKTMRIVNLEQEMQALQDKQAETAQIKGLMDKKEQELEEMSMKVAELQTEVTIARAELEGAYGSRSQRAAEVAANPAIQREIDTLNKNNKALEAEVATLKASAASNNSSAELQARLDTLQKELSETIEEYETMTKLSIEWEKEREELERTIDTLRDQRENLETQLSDEKVRWMGMKSPGLAPDGTMSGSRETSTTVLKNEFKKMMRDTRAENTKSLRAEQEQRRRLEEELRALKKLQGPGRSGLSNSIGS